MEINDKDLAKFLAEYPLYSKVSFCEIKDYDDELEVEGFFENRAYKFYCPYDKDYHTFKFQKRYGVQHLIRKNQVPAQYLDKDGKINISIYLESRC